MNSLKETILSRRSTRNFRKDMPSDEMISAVVEAGRFAPSGCNVQQCHFMVISNAEVLDKLRELVQQEFAKMTVDEHTFGSIVNSVNASKKGNYVFHYNPPVLVVVANSLDNPNNIADTSCAISDMMLMANELGLGSCWINQLRWLNNNEVLIDYLSSLGMKEDERVFGAMALGYPASETDRKPLDRTGNEVTIIR